MASPADAEAVAIAIAQVNGNPNTSTTSPADAIAYPSQSQSQSQFQPQLPANPDQTSAPTGKRKREDSDDGHQNTDDNLQQQPNSTPNLVFSDDQPLRDEKTLIKSYFQVLQSIDITPSILKRPLSDPSTTDEPASKKQKPDVDGAHPVSIEDKVNQDAYKLLDQLVLDLKKVIGDKDAELRSSTKPEDGRPSNHKALAQLDRFKEEALELHNREMAYPQLPPSIAGSVKLDELVQKPADDRTVLTVFGQAPQGRHLFSSLPKRTAAEDDSVKSLSTIDLPHGVSTTAVLPSAQQKPARVPNLGDMFPAPVTLPPLEAPKPPKTMTGKGKVLGYYHPELVDRSAYGHNKDSYYLKELSTGVWLDYSNAAPPSKNQESRRERTLSDNSTADDPDVTEVDALFRSVFSSFAPSKDDSGAVVSSGELGRLWYQRQGYRYMQQMMEPELDESDESNGVALITPADEEEIAQAVENWDGSLIDPSLGEVDKSQKSSMDKEVEETLQEISDLIETLASYQRNRHLTLPTGQNRSATDPGKANGLQASEPSDEERQTYQMLKDQLTVIIASLPPYAVARLNSDQLEELNVSTKIAVRSDVYKGVMEEDETSARLRHQQQQVAQAAQGAQRPPQRAPSFQSATPYQTGGQSQYNRQYQMATQTPVPVPNYQQSPVRAQVPPPSYQRQVSAPMPGMTPQTHRPAAGPFTRPSGWNGQQSMQPLRGYGAPGAVQSFQGTPPQARATSSYQMQAQPGTPSRFPPVYQGYTPQQQQQQHAMQSQYQQQHSGSIPPHMNGTGLSPQRNPSPQMSMAPQVSQFPAAQGYTSRPAPQAMSQARPYGPPGQTSGHPASIPRFPPNGVHPGQSQSPAPGSVQGGWPAQMTPEQRNQYQAQQRALAVDRANQFNSKMQVQQSMAVAGGHHGAAGLAGIGISSSQAADMQKMHLRASQYGGMGGPSSPSPRIPGAPSPAAMNGTMQVPSPSPGPVQGAVASPVPPAALVKPPTPV